MDNKEERDIKSGNKLTDEEKKKKYEFILKYAGSLGIEERFKDKSYKEIRRMIAIEKYGDIND